MSLTIEAVNREQGYIVDEMGQQWTVTDWFDDEGDWCGPFQAVACIATNSGNLLSVELEEGEGLETRH